MVKVNLFIFNRGICMYVGMCACMYIPGELEN